MTTDVKEVIQLLSDWIKSGEIGKWTVSFIGDCTIVFHHKDILTNTDIWEIQVSSSLKIKVWKKDKVVYEFQLQDSESFEHLGTILGRYGNGRVHSLLVPGKRP